MSDVELTTNLKNEARRLGFTLAGACPAVSPTGLHRLAEWLEAGYGGEMAYLSERQAAYQHPRHVLDGVRSLLVLAMPYRHEPAAAAEAGTGRVACYAWGELDYHDLIHRRLRTLKQLLLQQRPAARVRGVVDTAPLLEREFAQLAGLGWIGKNTLLLNRTAGSWFFLAALLTDQQLAYDDANNQDYCGTCTACLDACPTAAFPQPYVLDATRCISYLTIELRSSIPVALRSGVGDWLFGCDICQEVCPWNDRAAPASEPVFQPRPDLNPLELAGLFSLDDAAFRSRFRRTPLWRSKRRGILRNAAIVLGNQQSDGALGALRRAISDPEELVREASGWALGQIGGAAARGILEHQLRHETSRLVRASIEHALDG